MLPYPLRSLAETFRTADFLLADDRSAGTVTRNEMKQNNNRKSQSQFQINPLAATLFRPFQ